MIGERPLDVVVSKIITHNIWGVTMKALLTYISIIALWVTAVATDGNAGHWGWLAVDIIMSPVGVVRGLLILFGLAG